MVESYIEEDRYSVIYNNNLSDNLTHLLEVH